MPDFYSGCAIGISGRLTEGLLLWRSHEKATFEHYDELAAKNANFKTVYEPWKKFRSDILLWFSVAEIALDSIVLATEQARRR